MFSGIGTKEIVLVAVVLFVLFGGRKLPELARGIADSIKEFRRTVRE